MAEPTAIEWTDATWNPVTGCDKVSPGCLRCYAEPFSERFRGVPGHPFERGFDLTLRPDRLRQPLGWKSPRRIFVNSMSDLLHKRVPDEFIGRVFDVIKEADHHVFQVLTKRSSRMAAFTRRRYGDNPPPRNAWLGVSIEDGLRKARIAHLRRAAGAVRFLSIEPLIGPIGKMDLTGIDWVIVGGESGPGHRRMLSEWVDEIHEVC